MIQERHKPAEMRLSIGETLLSPNAMARGYASRRTERERERKKGKQTTQSRRDYTQSVSFFHGALSALYPLTSTVSRWPWAELVTSTAREGRRKEEKKKKGKKKHLEDLRFHFSGVPSKLRGAQTSRSSPSLRGDAQQARGFCRERAEKTAPLVCDGGSLADALPDLSDVRGYLECL